MKHHKNKSHKEAYSKDCWPTHQQELLLRAILLHDERAVDLFKEWKSSIDIERLDEGSYRLLPLLYKNLKQLGVSDPLMKLFKGVYRYHWYRNKILFHTMAPVLNAFHDAGIKTLILKGAALIPLYYNDFGLRPMNDFDVLVPLKRAPEAIRLLELSGWDPEPLNKGRMLIKDFYAGRHAHLYTDECGRMLDLHWHVLHECCHDGADDVFWAGAVPFKLEGVPTRTLNPTDHLMSICAHGARYSPVPTFRWVADVMAVLNRSTEDIDWQHLMRQARKRHLVLPLRDTLNYLHRLIDAPVPHRVLKKLSRMTVSRLNRLKYKYVTTKTYPKPFMKLLIMRWEQHKNITAGRKMWYRFVGFPKFLKEVWKLDHTWQISRAVVRKIKKRGFL